MSVIVLVSGVSRQSVLCVGSVLVYRPSISPRSSFFHILVIPNYLGHDFRPDYAKLGILKAHFPSVPILAVTATASDKVREDCMQILRMNPRRSKFFRSTADRPNLTYHVRLKDDTKDNVIEDMANYIKEHHGNSSGIVYAYSKNDADTLCDGLTERGIIAASYHSKVKPDQKDMIHRGWMRNDIQVVVATIAFGL